MAITECNPRCVTTILLESTVGRKVAIFGAEAAIGGFHFWCQIRKQKEIKWNYGSEWRDRDN